MKFTEYAVRNHQFTLLITLMIAVLGISALLNMPRAEDPEMDAPAYPITIIYPGTSPKDIEALAVKPLEEEIAALKHIKEVKSIIADGFAVMVIRYDYKVNPDEKFQELTRLANNMKTKLPEEIHSIDVDKFSPSDVNILQMELVSENASRDKMRRQANQLKKALETVPSLKDVEIQGMPDPIIRVDLDMDRLAYLKIPINAVHDALKSELAKVPGGTVVEGSMAYNIKTYLDFTSIDEISDIIIGGNEKRNIYLKDIAEVYADYAPQKHIVRLNGYRAVTVVASMKSGSNITAMQKEYLPIIDEFKQDLPSDIDLVLHFDQAENVNKRLSGLGRDFLIAISLVLLTLLPLGNRSSLVVMLAIPMSLAIGIIVLEVLGYSLNQLSIVGFVVALGLLVDDSIVVIENIQRWMREGYERKEAVIRATDQITLAVIGCTATLVIAFIPLVFLPEESGDFIRSLPVSIIATIVGSLFVALTLVPFFASRILKPTESAEGNIVLQYLQAGIHKVYAPILEKGLKFPRTTLVIAGLIFVGSIGLIPVVGLSLFPPSEKPQFLIDVMAPPQANLFYTDTIVQQLEQELKDIPEVQYFTSNAGRGNPQIYYNVLQKNESNRVGEIFVQLHPDTRSREKRKLIKQLREKWSPYPGARVEVKDFEQGQPMTAPVEVKIFGENLDSLRKYAAVVEDLITETEGTIYINNPTSSQKTDIKVNIDKVRAQSLGVPAISVATAVRAAISGLPVGIFNDPEEEDMDYEIILSVPRPSHADLHVLGDMYVNNIAGQSVPLSRIVHLEFESSPMSIDRLDKVRTTSITAHVQDGFLTDRVLKDVIKKMDKVDLPKGYSYTMGGEIEGRNESFGGFGGVILVAVFMFIAVLLLQFKTFKSTIIVLSVIPLGIVGAVIALLITGETLSFVATIGLIALAGIEVKNTILQVDFTNELREQGVALDKAIEVAGEARFLPIILTTLTSIGGLTPIALSSNPLVSPLAIVIIGGLVSSTLLSRIVTPVVYKLIPPKIEKGEKVALEN